MNEVFDSSNSLFSIIASPFQLSELQPNLYKQLVCILKLGVELRYYPLFDDKAITCMMSILDFKRLKVKLLFQKPPLCLERYKYSLFIFLNYAVSLDFLVRVIIVFFFHP